MCVGKGRNPRIERLKACFKIAEKCISFTKAHLRAKGAAFNQK
jgi:hypothetical protein